MITIRIALLSVLLILAQASQAVVPLGSTFTVQGKLNLSGQSPSGSFNFVVQAYDGETAGTLLGSQNFTAVNVNQGEFALDVNLNFIFDTEQVWLEISATDNGSGTNYALTPRLPVRAAPVAQYALQATSLSGPIGASDVDSNAIQLRVSGACAAGTAMTAINSNGTVTCATAGSGGVSVPLNLSGSETGSVLSVENTMNSGSPIAIYADASDTGSATSIGLRANSGSSSGYGVWATAPYVGVYSAADTYPIWAQSGTGGTAITGTGGGTGVDGTGVAYGVKGTATSTNSTSYGVYGSAQAGLGYAVYAEGDAHVEGDLTWKAKTARNSIPAQAFQPSQPGYNYLFDGPKLVDQNNPGSNPAYFAPVQLPDGATITEVKFFWRDGSSRDGDVVLTRADQVNDTESTMVLLASTGGDSDLNIINSSTTSSTSIANPTIDNANYRYYMLFRPSPDHNGVPVVLRSVVITYTTTHPH